MSFFKSVLSCVYNACSNAIGAVVSLVFPSSSKVKNEEVCVVNNHSLNNTSHYTGPWARAALYDYCKPRTAIHSPYIISKETRIPFVTLPHHYIPKELKNLLDYSFRDREETGNRLQLLETLNIIRPLLCEKNSNKLSHNRLVLDEKNYITRFRHMIWIEEFEALEEFRVIQLHDLRNITSKGSKYKIVLEINSISKEHTSLISKGDSVLITSKYLDNKSYDGTVEVYNIANNLIDIKIEDEFNNDVISRCCPSFDLKFLGSRYAFRLNHKALDDLKRIKHRIATILFPRLYEQNVKNVSLRPFFNKNVDGNREQISAIKNIVQNRAYPAPYIIYGPPGTGKTATLVEAIAQIWSIFRDSKILVCASSNTAADVIGCRLVQWIPIKDITRVYASSRDYSCIPEALKYCSNFNPKTNEIFFPSIYELANKRIVIMTCATAGRYANCKLNFDYLFIDEASHMVEVDALIPIVAFLNKVNCYSLILSGDFEQLEPVVKSPAAKALGYDMSLLERLVKHCNLYKTMKVQVITMLVNNYRSHEKILHVPNKLFYGERLLAKGAINKISCFCNWQELPVSNFPIIFHSVKGTEIRENNCKSYSNDEEIEIILKYIKDIFASNVKVDQKDIGIISPYLQQVKKLRERLRTSWSNIDVASVDEFQGQERKVIIISTVRSCYRSLATKYKNALGFLKNRKRFNVAITRAEALLIVIGDPDVLQCDPCWRVFIDYCVQNGALIGRPARNSVPSDFNPYEDRNVEFKAV